MAAKLKELSVLIYFVVVEQNACLVSVT